MLEVDVNDRVDGNGGGVMYGDVDSDNSNDAGDGGGDVGGNGSERENGQLCETSARSRAFEME